MEPNNTFRFPCKTVLVLGGRGFIGRNTVKQLQRGGAKVIIGSRCKLKPRDVGLQRVRLHEKQTDSQVKEMLRGIDVVINTVGILRQRIAETYDDVHHKAVAQWSRVCRENHIRYIHICDLLFITPFSFGHYELLKYDNCSDVNRLPELLGRPGKRVGSLEAINSRLQHPESKSSLEELIK